MLIPASHSRIWRALLLSLAALGLTQFAGDPTHAAPPSRYIVMLSSGDGDIVARGHGIVPTHSYRALRGFAATLTDGQRERLRADPRVLGVTPDRPMATAGVTATLGAAEPALPSGINRIDAEFDPVVESTGIAILDTGIDLGRAEFNIAGAQSFVAAEPTAQDGFGHGTHVAGTAAATIMGSGFRGAAPRAPLWGLKVLDSSGNGSESDLIAAIDWLTANGPALNIRVANLSLRADGTADTNCGMNGQSIDDPLHYAICQSVQVGVIYVVAAGNGGTDAANWVPAAYPEVIAVSNVQDLDGRGGALGGTGDDTLASSSNYGAAVDVAAPGSNILSTVPVGDCGFCSSSGYALLTGTSMAAPHVAGVIAEYIERHAGVSTVGAQNMLAPAAVQALALGQPQTSACGFSGDPDATPEPVIYGGAPDSDCGATPTPDTDADGLPDIVESGVYGTSSTSADTDGDGCPDGREAAANEASGGRRNPRADGLGRWDFYDVNGSQKVDALDIAMVRSKFNGTGPTPPADTPFDRSGGLHPWAPGPPDNKINALDIGLVRASFGHTCR